MSICSFAGIADSSTCASWIQAWGSIAAILAAVLVAYVQHRQNLKAQRERTRAQDVQAVAAHLALAERTTNELRGLLPLIERSGGQEFFDAVTRLHKVGEDLELFNSLPVQFLPTYEAITSVRGLSRHIRAAIDHLMSIQLVRTTFPKAEEQTVLQVRAFEEAIDIAEAECVLLAGNFDRHGRTAVRKRRLV